VYQDKMLRATLLADRTYGGWCIAEGWMGTFHHGCRCRQLKLPDGRIRAFGGHRDKYIGRNGKSHRARQQEGQQQRQIEKRQWRNDVVMAY
jgi:hypothetical protein